MNREDLARLAERHRIPGAQLVLYRDGETVLVQTGRERYGDGPPVTARSAFPYGSVTKAFTATVVLQLVSSGDLDLDKPIGSYLSELALSRNGIEHTVTVRQLLSHSSGLPCDFDENGPPAPSFRRYALSAGTLEPVYQPGTAFSYSNAGYVLLGLLIDEISWMSWWDAIESLLLDPLDIEPAFCADPRIPARNRTIVSGHSVTDRRTISIQPAIPVFDAPAGGLAGSAADLVAFARMHLGDAPALLAGPDRELMRTGAGELTPFGLASGWGLGIARFRSAQADWFGHDGTTDGTTCHLRFEPVSRVALALTTNGVNGLRLWEDVLAALRAEGLDVGNYPAARLPGGPVPAVPECVGVYRNGDVEYVVTQAQDGAWSVDLDDGIARNLTFYQGLRFCAEAPGTGEPTVAGRFLREPGTGEIGLMEIGGRAARRSRVERMAGV